MIDRTKGSFSCHVENIRNCIERGELPFQDCLSGDFVVDLVARLGIVFRDRIYTPGNTLLAFVTQVLSADQSCRNAVRQFMAMLVSNDEQPCAPTTSSYCEARSRLPEQFYNELVGHTGRSVSPKSLSSWNVLGRPVKVVDGTMVSIPETEANCEEYPLADAERAGFSFPTARVFVVFALSVGTVLEHVIRPNQGKGTGELSMFVGLIDTFRFNDIVLGDEGFCSYGHVALLRDRCTADIVVKLNPSRLDNLTRMKRLAKNDCLYRWSKPKQRPTTIDNETFDNLPDEVLVRLVHVHVTNPGFRPDDFVVLTTILDHKHFSAEVISRLYCQRWRCELYLRDIKTTLQMDMLRCKTPEMIRKEIATHLIAYNLIRIHIAQAAACFGIHPNQISFKGALQTMRVFRILCRAGNANQTSIILASIGYEIVGQQPGRIEPRKLKRRPKDYPYLSEPREAARNHELNST